jgi:hypothetical protein
MGLFRDKVRFSRLSGKLLWFCFAVGLMTALSVGSGVQAAAQSTIEADAPEAIPSAPRLSMVRDWSHRHILFTNGGTPEVVVASQRDPRFLHNWLYRNARLLGLGQIPQTVQAEDQPLEDQPLREQQAAAGTHREPRTSPTHGFLAGETRNRRSKIDWAVSLGPTGGMPLAEAPAKFSFDINKPPDCVKDFVVYTIGAAAAAGTQANLVAFNNLYSGPGTSFCNRTTPTFMWSYAVGTGASFLSPTLSLDGKKVAFIEAGTRAIFHVVTWATGAGQGTNATTGSVVPNGASSATSLDYTNITTAGCTANGAGDSNASAFVDYNTDAVYLAADNGILYRVKGTFTGTPTLDYCVTVTAGAALTSPVYDSVSNKVFISDGRSLFAYTPGTTSFTAAGSIQISSSATGIILSPMVDSTNGFVYVFSNNNNANVNSIVSQIPTSLASHTDALIGLKTTGLVLVGDFDNKYFANGPSVGSLYACGTQSNAGGKPALYTLSFTATGVMNTTPAMSNDILIDGAGNPAGICSPLTEFFDGTNDRLFAGVGSFTSTAGANLMTMWNINNRITSNATTPTATATNEIGGTSAISIDNVSTSPQAASIYFGTMLAGAASPCGANLFCAVKLTQSGLQ